MNGSSCKILHQITPHHYFMKSESFLGHHGAADRELVSPLAHFFSSLQGTVRHTIALEACHRLIRRIAQSFSLLSRFFDCLCSVKSEKKETNGGESEAGEGGISSSGSLSNFASRCGAQWCF